MELTEHFTYEELGLTFPAGDSRLVENALFLCRQLLEPIRAHFGAVIVNDGYRAPGHNASVGGKPTSYHLFTDGRAAADIKLAGAGLPEAFDWIRLESALPFDKVILEAAAGGDPRCIHLQIDRLNPPRRQAFTGSTGAGTVYPEVEVR